MAVELVLQVALWRAVLLGPEALLLRQVILLIRLGEVSLLLPLWEAGPVDALVGTQELADVNERQERDVVMLEGPTKGVDLEVDWEELGDRGVRGGHQLRIWLGKKLGVVRGEDQHQL